MRKSETPQDEQARLETLWSLSVLDTAPEERIDRLARMAKRLFGVPIALVSLVDKNRLWFKSRSGLSVSEISRHNTFCGHTILGDDLFIIKDTIADERFADSPLVLSDPYIRFYAGCPLSAPNGLKLGTLCILDRQPRDFDKEDLEALRDLAYMVEREIVAVQISTLDELTAISNRRGFIMLAQHNLRLCLRQQLPASLVFMDLDKFKIINDRFGHAEGDWVLTVFAEQMNTVCRDSDVYARFGGDEFAMFLLNTSKQQAEDIVARIRQSLIKHNQKANCGYDILFSHGIVEFDPEKHSTVEAMLAEGDSLMYRLKRSKA